MNRIIYAAAVAAIGAFGVVGCDRNQTANNNNPANPPGQQTSNDIKGTMDQAGKAMDRGAHDAGQAMGDATTRVSDAAQQAGAAMRSTTQPSAESTFADAGTVRSAIAADLNDAVAKDSFGSIIKDLSESSRNAIGDYSKVDISDLNGIVTQILGDWKGKYGHDFKATADAFGSDAFVITGTPDRTSATVTLASTTGFNGLVVPLKKEGVLRNWYIDAPTTLTAQKLHDNLSREFTAIKDAKANWPADENEAYRVVAQHVLAAVLDRPSR